METKFTKGNWFIKESKIEETDTTCQTVLMTDLKHNNIKSPVICDLYAQATEEGKANARLLCAAPELLEQLIESRKLLIAAGYKVWSYRILEIDKAIKKALGSDFSF